MRSIKEQQIKIELNNRMIHFLELPQWRKMIHIKSVFGSDGMKQSELEKLLVKIKAHFELSLSREFKLLPHEIYQISLDGNMADRKFLRYRNYPNISGRR